MQVRRFYTKGLSIYSYLIFDEKTGQGALIDPTVDIQPYLLQALQDEVVITDIVETHVHADFISGSPYLKKALGGLPRIHASGMGGEEWTPRYADHVIQNFERIAIGNIVLEAVHTPGHTPEHIVWVVYDGDRAADIPCVLFSGDLLFVGSIGRPDLLGQESLDKLLRQLYASVHILCNMPEFLQVFPSHGAASLCGKSIGVRETTTIGFEKKCNPWLNLGSFTSYLQWNERLLEGMPKAPPYFKKMKEMNVVGFFPSDKQQQVQLLTAQQVIAMSHDACIVEIRAPTSFAKRHFKGSINIPPSPNFLTWAGSVLPYDVPLILVSDVLQKQDMGSIVKSLQLIGLDNILGVCNANELGTLNEDSIDKSLEIDVEFFSKNMDRYYIVDVRGQAEWDVDHIDGAHHVELTCLNESLQQIPKGVPLAMICRSGARAMLAASMLQKADGYLPAVVVGGMLAYNSVVN